MLARTSQYIIPYRDLVDVAYISVCNRFKNPNQPALAVLGFSEIEHIVKECFNGILYDISGNASYVANLDETLFPAFRERIKHALFSNGILDIRGGIIWWDYLIEETLFPKVIERLNILRTLGPVRSRIDWMYDQGCILVKV